MSITIKRVDYQCPRDCENFVRLMSEYAKFEMGEEARDVSTVPEQLAAFPTSFSVLAISDQQPDRAVGLINCFFGFSTFTGKRLVNIHDVIVTESHRGQGIGGMMLAKVEEIAREADCCRLTLEVYTDNTYARKAYQKFGFAGDPAHPDVDILFLRKALK